MEADIESREISSIELFQKKNKQVGGGRHRISRGIKEFTGINLERSGISRGDQQNFQGFFWFLILEFPRAVQV